MRRFPLVCLARHHLATPCMASTADHSLLRRSQGCRATLSLTSKDKSHHGRIRVALLHRKDTERSPSQTHCRTWTTTFSSLIFIVFSTLISLHALYFIPVLWRIERDRRNPHFAEGLSSLWRWSHRAMRETTFRTPPRPQRLPTTRRCWSVAKSFPVGPRGARLHLIVPHLVDRWAHRLPFASLIYPQWIRFIA